jgi:hypothetical protein
MEKVYEVCVTFGDGRPLNTQVKAKNGVVACDLVRKEHPCARVIHILGLVDTPVDNKV